MKQIILSELGYFSERECQAIKDISENKTYMNFKISWSNEAGNCILIISTNYDATKEEIKNFFISYIFREIYFLKR